MTFAYRMTASPDFSRYLRTVEPRCARVDQLF
jgi:hypothetical protein